MKKNKINTIPNTNRNW